MDNTLDVLQVGVKKLATCKDGFGQIAHIDHVLTALAAVVVMRAHHAGATSFLVCKDFLCVAETAVVVVHHLGK